MQWSKNFTFAKKRLVNLICIKWGWSDSKLSPERGESIHEEGGSIFHKVG
jgi:hypothetical protein